jgi:C-terminal processing protease CtpA/Prc
LTEPRTTRVRFSDGTEYVDIWQKSGRGGKYIPALSYEVDYYKRMLQSYSRNWDFKELNYSTVLLTVNTFTLNDVEVDDIVSKIGENVQKENMIIDLRLNPGGHVSAMNRLLSVFIDTTSVALNQYAMVNSNASYESFKYSLNYDQSIAPFEEFKQIEGKKGFYADSEYPVNDIIPDSLVHYPGKVYILTSDQSCSAATVFASVLVRNHRAVTVGRETGTAYHYVTAMKFADIQLPNSKIQVHIPLVKEVFDDVVNERVPYGRGLLPDYEVPVTYEEFFTAKNDIILGKALELIAEGKYLRENPFEVKEDMSECAAKGKSLYMYLLLGILAAGGAVWVARKRK